MGKSEWSGIPKRQKIRIVGSQKAARHHGYGSVVYHFIEGSKRRFPQDVEYLMIMHRVQVDTVGSTPQYANAVAKWDVKKPNGNGSLWKLTGTHEKPTLSPSLHWVGSWHGWLRNGVLEFIGT